MRLLNAETMQLELFLDEAKLPPYTILSHCWGDEEVSLQDLQSGTFRHLRGFQKIDACCRKTALDLCKYTWIDTCCIDKTSSAELSEAINSMFRWYENAAVCYAFLEDVAWDLGEGTWVRNDRDMDMHGYRSDSPNVARLRKARWFRRGWTLQELIAPDAVVFFDQQWREVGERTGMAHLLSEITGIDKDLLAYRRLDIKPPLLSALQSYPVATRMAWASMRETTRPEDEAYCLLGLFGINMPLIYGEGRRAFFRLQREIILEGPDASILLWDGRGSRGFDFHGALAPSPAGFKSCLSLELPRRSQQPTFEGTTQLWATPTVQPAATPTIQPGTSNRTVTLTAPMFSLLDLGTDQLPLPVFTRWLAKKGDLPADPDRRLLADSVAIVARTADNRAVGILLATDPEGRFVRTDWSLDLWCFPLSFNRFRGQAPRTIVLQTRADSLSLLQLPESDLASMTVVLNIHPGYTMSKADSPDHRTRRFVFVSDTASLPPFAVALDAFRSRFDCCILPEKTPEDPTQQLVPPVGGLQLTQGMMSTVLVPGMYNLTVALRRSRSYQLRDRLIVSMVPHAGVHVADGDKWTVRSFPLPGALFRPSFTDYSTVC